MRRRWVVELEGLHSGRRTRLGFARFRTRGDAEAFAAHLNDQPSGDLVRAHVHRLKFGGRRADP